MIKIEGILQKKKKNIESFISTVIFPIDEVQTFNNAIITKMNSEQNIILLTVKFNIEKQKIPLCL